MYILTNRCIYVQIDVYTVQTDVYTVYFTVTLVTVLHLKQNVGTVGEVGDVLERVIMNAIVV